MTKDDTMYSMDNNTNTNPEFEAPEGVDPAAYRRAMERTKVISRSKRLSHLAREARRLDREGVLA